MVSDCNSKNSPEVFYELSVLESKVFNTPINELEKWLSSPVIKFCDFLKVFKVRMRTDYEGWQKDFKRQHVKAIKWQMNYNKEN